ncbi:MAG: (d)CMP kinase [Planctomycetota bacterium]|nr:(d)CMP kinase [Planctomycetota bacterium]
MSQLAADSTALRLDAGELLNHTRPPRRLIVTIDGPAGTGKSSVARELALRLGLDFLDTGAMYRAATALALDSGTDLGDEPAIAELVRQADLRFDWTTDPPTLLARGRSIMHRLREPEVTSAVSPVSSLPAVRRVLVERQRRIGEVHQRLVSEGRDQGSVVFFDADVKIYLEASLQVRARRRADQLRREGRDADLAAIEREIADRDHRDSTRAVGPLTCPDDAQRFDTSTLDQRGVVDALARLVLARAS